MEHEYFRNFCLSPFLIYEDVRSQTKVKQFMIYFLTSKLHIFSGSPFSHSSALTFPPASCTIPHYLLICLDSSYISSGREGGREGGKEGDKCYQDWWHNWQLWLRSSITQILEWMSLLIKNVKLEIRQAIYLYGNMEERLVTIVAVEKL